MDSKYVYIKKRNQFGKQCFFEDIGPIVEENILPEPSLARNYIKQSITHRSTQEAPQYAIHEIQTKYASVKNSGIVHFEGSWPKEINPLDEEAVRRFRQRVTRSDNWTTTMNSLMEKMEHSVLQNNSIDIHDHYFDDMIPTKLTTSPEMRIVSVYCNQELNVRPVNHLSWLTDTDQFAVAYCFKSRLKFSTNLSPNVYIWNIASASVTIEFNQRDPALLISGLMSGQVCSWDTRTGDSPVQISVPLHSHRNQVNQTYWINSKTNTEFFSSSISGSIKWWDIRKLKSPTEILVMDLENPERQSINESIPICVLQYEPTMGTKFLVGLENGIVVNVNRKALSKTEKLHTRYRCHLGPILSIDRNPTSLKNFLTIDSSLAKVWTEETKEHCLVETRKRKSGALTGTCWSRSRLSLFFTINTEGMMNVYDLLQGINKPCYGIKISEKSLTTIKPNNNGNILGIGSSDGNVYFVLCGGLFTTTFPNDKFIFQSYLDKCNLYEKAVETRKKEIALTVTHMSPRPSKIKSRRRASRDITRRSKIKKHHGASSFLDEEIIEAEKQYFLKLEAVFEQPDSTSHLTFTKLFSETLFRLKESLRNNELFELKLHGPIHPIFKVSYCINMKYR
ncbi:dynein axonemal intermediate chain 2-like isoform X1 [Vespula squamosa]|uniref:Dynein axonemal intermediate chain 2-like isoform X1 n=1 Tax=Vespula squamosa TaxID=30214 RepID=A0ABD1ZWW4_VESSQ